MLALDARLGLNGYFSPQARRLVCLAGVSWPFGKAQDHLHEFSGLRVSAEAIRQASHGEAVTLAAWRAEAAEAMADFQAASRDIEFQTDAGKVNTTAGWKNVKIGIFAKRPRGLPTAPEHWATRDLPQTTCRYAFAAIETSGLFGARWGVTARRLGIKTTRNVHVLGDGAEWIWNEAAKELPWATGTLDVFHGVEHVADAAKALWGEGSAAAAAWTEAGRLAMLRDGWWGLCEHLGQTVEQPPPTEPPAAVQAAVDGLTTYFAKQQDHLDYCLRLRNGQSIGSGLVEGACKNTIGKRLKQTGARWDADRVNRMAELCCAVYSDNWRRYWERN
ncbi:MAG: ISLre2 family transposase [Gemmataceae bacterium]